jgi:hypothetical protein
MVAMKHAQRRSLLVAMVNIMRDAIAKPEKGTCGKRTGEEERSEAGRTFILIVVGMRKSQRACEIRQAEMNWETLAWSHSGDSTVARKTSRKERESSQWAVMAALQSGLASDSHRSAMSTLSCSPGAAVYFARSLTAASLRISPTRTFGQRGGLHRIK